MNFYIFLVSFTGGSLGDLIGYNRGQNNVNRHNLNRRRMSRLPKNDKKQQSDTYKLLLKFLSEP